jgi:hypothetical protein
MAPASDLCLDRNVQQMGAVSEVHSAAQECSTAVDVPDAFSAPIMRPAFGESM